MSGRTGGSAAAALVAVDGEDVAATAAKIWFAVSILTYRVQEYGTPQSHTVLILNSTVYYLLLLLMVLDLLHRLLLLLLLNANTQTF